ncbi:MAG TPA: glycoside hydrolase family 66 protein [Galbitalea sp.]
MSGLEILPTRSTYSAGESVEIEVRGAAGPGDLVVRQLGDEVLRVPYSGEPSLVLGWLPVGTFGVELVLAEQSARTAVEVTMDARARLRYGFVVDYSPDRDLRGISDTVRRLHLTDVQFYDWAYRHADLLGGGEEYRDALDQPISLQSVRDLVGAVRHAGARALGYAAVYAVGPSEWPTWKHRALITAAGDPYGLGDFLFVLDPAAPDWLQSFTGQLSRAVAEVGFDGFHLDQYGYPKVAVRADGVVVDVSNSFATLIDSVRAALPAAHLIFNNVNDFPTWVTARLEQDAVYIEPWEPHLTLGSLGALVARTRGLAGKKPIALAAYQHVYDSAPAASADTATALTMATLYSHGATQLLAGETDRILVDPYYVRNHVVEASTADLLKRWYDFLVEHDALLLDPGIVDVTGSYAGGYNDDCDVAFPGVTIGSTAVPGTVWRRVTSIDSRLVVHLINLIGQDDALWDAPRNEQMRTGEGTLRIRRVAGTTPRVRVADPDGLGRLIDVPVTLEGNHATATIPDFGTWQIVVIDLVNGDAE